MKRSTLSTHNSSALNRSRRHHKFIKTSKLRRQARQEVFFLLQEKKS